MQNVFPRDAFIGFAPSEQFARDSALLRATTELFVQEPAHDRDETRRFEELAVNLVPRVSTEDRIFLADRLAPRLDAPPSLMRMLAKDAIEVAAAVIRKSPVLTSLDLLSVIATTGPEHHRLLAERPGLSPDVARALRVTGDKDVIATLGKSTLREESGAQRHVPPAEGAPAASATSAAAESARSATPPLHRFDPWLFLALERSARLQAIAELAARPPSRRYSGPTERVDRAFRSMLSAALIVGFARSGQRERLVDVVAESIEVDRDFVVASLDDRTGEALAILLKAIALENVQAQQVFLLAASKVGRDVDAFFRLCDLYTALEPIVAENLAGAWSAGRIEKAAHHQPLFVSNGERQRSTNGEAARDRQPLPAERARQG